jgi:hypothetical protein
MVLVSVVKTVTVSVTPTSEDDSGRPSIVRRTVTVLVTVVTASAPFSCPFASGSVVGSAIAGAVIVIVV